MYAQYIYIYTHMNTYRSWVAESPRGAHLLRLHRPQELCQHREDSHELRPWIRELNLA